jgi:hypothetical protein
VVTPPQQYASLISDDDMRYVLSVLAVMGLQFCDTCFAWRPFTSAERQVSFLHWMHIGKMMNIQMEGLNWTCYNDCLEWKQNYERSFRKFDEANNLVSTKSVFFFCSKLPAFLVPHVYPLAILVISAMQESATSRALGLPEASAFIRLLVEVPMRLRGFIWRCN